MRDRETIDAELRRIALGRRAARGHGGQASSRELDDLLDELLAQSTGAAFADTARTCETEVVADTRSRGRSGIRPRRRKGVPRHVGFLVALPLSLMAIVATVVVMFAVHHQDPSAQPEEPPPSAAPTPKRIAPHAPAPRIEVADAAFIAALKHEGVPVPSQDYAMTQGHAVCDFLAHQPNFADAVEFVQRSSIWDANQSAEVTAGAIVSYCPQSQPATTTDLSPAYQNALSDLQAIEGKLQGIEGDLHGLQGDLDRIPGPP
jgi:hypothetical protein